MVSKEELLAWVQALPDGSGVGVDDGGLALMTQDEKQYFEVGGLPRKEDELDDDGQTGIIHKELGKDEVGVRCMDCNVLLLVGEKVAENPDERLYRHELTCPPTVFCGICHNDCNAGKAHRHQGQFIGDECCWDEKLRSSE